MQYCPQCHSDNIESTTMGIIRSRDTNRARCFNCDWVGEAWQTQPNWHPAIEALIAAANSVVSAHNGDYINNTPGNSSVIARLEDALEAVSSLQTLPPEHR